MSPLECAQRIVDGQVPMALVPTEILLATEDWKITITRGERTLRTLRKIFLYLCFIEVVVLFFLFGLSMWVYAFLGAMSVDLLFLVTISEFGNGVESKKRYLNGRHQNVFSLYDFANRFSVLLDAFGASSKKMGKWEISDIVYDAKAILRSKAQEVKRLQNASPSDPLAGLAEKVEFKRLHTLFSEWMENFGEHGQYFE